MFLPLVTTAQVKYEGIIIDRTSKKSIPYASIGLQTENIGINADENGFFALYSNGKNLNDTIIIACIGYQTRKISVSEFVENKKVELTEKHFALPEVSITKNNNTSVNLNNFNDCGHNYQSAGKYTNLLAQQFRADEPNLKLTKLRICLSGDRFAKKKVSFRIRILGFDSLTSSPSSDLYNQKIEVNLRIKEIVEIDLTKYGIVVPTKDFFIAIEWLKIKKNESSADSKEQIAYLPSVGWKIKTDSTLNFWHLFYNNEWYKHKEGTLLMSAILKK